MDTKNESLNLGLALYGSYGNLAAAGYENEVLKAYANYVIQLTHKDIQDLRRIFLCQFDDRWEDLIRRYKDK